MQYLFIFSLLVTSQTYSHFGHVEKLKHDIEKIQQSIAAPFNKKIEKEEKKLSALFEKIQEKQSFKNIKNRIEEFKAIDLYKQKAVLEGSLKVIADLLNYTITIEAPQLLASVSQLIETPGLTNDLKPFLYKQRARLMDSLDEGLFSASLAKQIHILQKNLAQELEFCIAGLAAEPLYKELAALHTSYLKEKEPKQALASTEKTMALECDKIAAMYKNKELQSLTSALKFYLLGTPETNHLPLYPDPIRLQLISEHQYKLLLRPLDIYVL